MRKHIIDNNKGYLQYNKEKINTMYQYLPSIIHSLSFESTFFLFDGVIVGFCDLDGMKNQFKKMITSSQTSLTFYFEIALFLRQ